MRLGDMSFAGNNEEFKANLAALAKRLRSVGRELFSRGELGDGCRVYPALAESTAAQLDQLGRLFQEPIEITAGICRTVFEIEVVLR